MPVVPDPLAPLGRLVMLGGLIVAFALFGLTPQLALAGPVNPEAVTLTQPDGTVFQAIPYGDEWSNGYETAAGHTLIQQPASGFWHLAEIDVQGRLVPSAIGPEQTPPVGLAPHLRPTLSSVAAPQAPARMNAEPQASGTHPTVVLLVQFANRTSVGSTAAQWSTSFFGPTDSVKHYYNEVSYGNLNITAAGESHGMANDGVIGWLSLGYNHPDTRGDFGTANVKLARDAMVAADPFINYAAYDKNGDGFLSTDELHIVVIAAGYETSYGGAAGSCTPGLWGHQYALRYGPTYGVSAPVLDGKTVGYHGYTEFGEAHCAASTSSDKHMATIGIMVHEMGHDLNWPDLYDTDNSSYGVGQWSVMGYGSWLRTTGFAGSKPPHPDAYLKWYQGWITPQPITGSQNGVALGQVATNARAIQLLANPGGVDWSFNNRSGTGEFFLVENRQKVGYDAGLPGCGLLVWHIDETRLSDNRTNATDTRRLVDLEEADGLSQIDTRASYGDGGDPFPGTTSKKSFNNTTNPNSKLYSGAASGVSIANISSACAATMNADFVTPANTTLAKKVRLPLILRAPAPVVTSSISGVVRYNKQGIGGITLQLDSCNDDATDCISVGNTVSAGNGAYSFAKVPALGAGRFYQVVYQNGPVGGNADNNNHLAYWVSFRITSLPAGGSVAGGDFDIATVVLQSPANGASLTVPATFTWSNRFVGGDTYAWAIGDTSGNGICSMDPPAATTSFIMDIYDGENCGLYWDTTYRWYVYVASNGAWSNGFGLSRFYRNVSFRENASLTGPMTSQQPGSSVLTNVGKGQSPQLSDPAE
jgi:M6 family metalloprotease-like protein